MQFVAEALQDPAQEFGLFRPIPLPGRPPLIPTEAAPQGKSTSPPILPTLESEELVPASMIKFRPVCLGPPGYTGLLRAFQEMAQPMTSVPFPPSETSGS